MTEGFGTFSYILSIINYGNTTFYIIVMAITHSEKLHRKNKFAILKLITLNCSGFSCMIRTFKKCNIDRLIAFNYYCTTRVFRHQISTKKKLYQLFPFENFLSLHNFVHIGIFLSLIMLSIRKCRSIEWTSFLYIYFSIGCEHGKYASVVIFLPMKTISKNVLSLIWFLFL